MAALLENVMHTGRPSRFARVEIEGLQALSERLDGPMAIPFTRAVGCFAMQRKSKTYFVTGMGKSGIIAQKIAAILRSSCSPANFMHSADAAHGEIGMLSPGAVVVALSYKRRN